MGSVRFAALLQFGAALLQFGGSALAMFAFFGGAQGATVLCVAVVPYVFACGLLAFARGLLTVAREDRRERNGTGPGRAPVAFKRPVVEAQARSVTPVAPP